MVIATGHLSTSSPSRSKPDTDKQRIVPPRTATRAASRAGTRRSGIVPCCLFFLWLLRRTTAFPCRRFQGMYVRRKFLLLSLFVPCFAVLAQQPCRSMIRARCHGCRMARDRRLIEWVSCRQPLGVTRTGKQTKKEAARSSCGFNRLRGGDRLGCSDSNRSRPRFMPLTAVYSKFPDAGGNRDCGYLPR